MRFLVLVPLLVPLMVLAACDQPAPSAPPAAVVQCSAAGYQGLIGQPESVLKSMMLPAGSRVIGPGDAVTMDYRPDRLNVETGTDHRIAKIACY